MPRISARTRGTVASEGPDMLRASRPRRADEVRAWHDVGRRARRGRCAERVRCPRFGAEWDRLEPWAAHALTTRAASAAPRGALCTNHDLDFVFDSVDHACTASERPPAHVCPSYLPDPPPSGNCSSPDCGRAQSIHHRPPTLAGLSCAMYSRILRRSIRAGRDHLTVILGAEARRACPSFRSRP